MQSSSGAGSAHRFVWMILAVYGISFLLPVGKVSGGWVYGWGVFLSGLVVNVGMVLSLIQLAFLLLSGGMQNVRWEDVRVLVSLAAWFANLALWVGLACLARHRWRGAARAGVVAFLLALSFAFCLPSARGDTSRLAAGYYVWLTSMALLPPAALWAARRARWSWREEIRRLEEELLRDFRDSAEPFSWEEVTKRPAPGRLSGGETVPGLGATAVQRDRTDGRAWHPLRNG